MWASTYRLSRQLRCVYPSRIRYKSSVEKTHIDNATLFKQLSGYIEDNEAIAHTLGKVLSRESAESLAKALATELAKNSESVNVVARPSKTQLRQCAMQAGIPFIGFGLIDNAIMIIAGEYIDIYLAVSLNISTMGAAALGNLVSDVCGVGLGSFVERVAARMGLPDPMLSKGQRKLSVVRKYSSFGCALGVAIGCLIGMFPLLFLPGEQDELKQSEKVVSMIHTVMREATSYLDCDSVTLFIVEHETETLYSHSREYSTVRDLTLTFDDGPVGSCAKTGRVVNVPCDEAVKGMLCMPVVNTKGQTIAVIQAIGKHNHTTNTQIDDNNSIDNVIRNKSTYCSFSSKDEALLRALCSHISVDLENIKKATGAKLDLKDTIQTLKAHGDLKLIEFS